MNIVLKADGKEYKNDLFIKDIGFVEREKLISLVREAIDLENNYITACYSEILSYILENTGGFLTNFGEITHDDLVVDFVMNTVRLKDNRVSFTEFIKYGFEYEPNVVKFRYTNAKGQTKLHAVQVLDEDDIYLCGLDKDDDSKYKKFLKHKISFKL